MTDGQSTEQLRPLETEPAREVRVLAAEDDSALRMVNNRLFGLLVGEGKPFDHFAIFPDANAALEEFKRDGNYTALITDHNMPGMTGAELAKRLKLLKPNIVTVLFSSKTKEDLEMDRETRDLAQYIDLSLEKPIGLSQAESMAKEISRRVKEINTQ